MKHIDRSSVDKLCREAAGSPRRRAHLNLHDDLEEDLQRLLIALQPDTYIRPHRHPEDYKRETLVILRGRCACYTFNDSGEVDRVTILDPREGSFVCEIPDQQWHSLACLEADTVVLEFKRGPYVPLAPENFAPWAPEETSDTRTAYLESLAQAERSRRRASSLA